MKGILILITRIFVATTFIFSGVVKLVDPKGTAYKFTEYFGADVLNLEFLIPYALPLSILLIAGELMLGFALLLAYKPKLNLLLLLSLNLLFLFLTWYSAYFDKVTDCGCFGDAVKLTSWETFYKNIVLTFLVLLLYFNKGFIAGYFSDKILRNILIAFTLIVFYTTYHVLVHLPLIDFRAYAVGKNIKEGMEYVDGSDELPPVHDFFLESQEADLTETILAAEKVVLIVSYDIDKSDLEAFSSLKAVADEAINQKYQVYGVSASSEDDLQLLIKEFNLPFEFLFCDETTLKTIVRANPGIVVLKKGTVVAKYNWRDADKLVF